MDANFQVNALVQPCLHYACFYMVAVVCDVASASHFLKSQNSFFVALSLKEFHWLAEEFGVLLSPFDETPRLADPDNKSSLQHNRSLIFPKSRRSG